MFLVERVFHHDGQAGLELLTSGDLPASAFQNAEMTGMSHCAQPSILSLLLLMLFTGILFVCLRLSLALSPGWSAVVPSQLTANLCPQVQAILMSQPPE